MTTQSTSEDPAPKTISAILLAAGRSQRMGAFKPLLPFGRTTVIESCIDYLEKGGVENIVVVVGHRAEELQEHLSESHLMFAFNDDPNSEMNVSIARGVAALRQQTGCVLIALVDHPAVPSQVVSALLGEWRKNASLVIPSFNGRGGHPVLCDWKFREQLLRLDSHRGLKSLFETHQNEVRRVPVSSPYVARDIDTWDDYVALHQDVFGYTPPLPE